MRLVPDARFEPRDTALEEASWNDVLGRLYETTPRISTPRRGLVYYEPLNFEGPTTRSPSVQLVERLNIQGAVAPARSFARLAAFRSGPGRILDLAKEDVDAFLGSFQTSWLPQVSSVPKEVADRLVLFGYRTLRDLRGLSKKHLSAQFGDVGTRIYQLLYPGDVSRVSMMQPLPRVSQRFTFEQPVREPGSLRPVVKRLVTRCCNRLADRFCQRIEVRFTQRSGDEHITSRVLRGLTREEEVLQKQAAILLKKLLRDDRRVQTVQLVLGALGRPVAEQGSLFAQRPKIQAAVDAVQRRYPEALLRAVTDPNAVFEEQRFYMKQVGET